MSTSRYAYEHISPGIIVEDMHFGERGPRPGDRLPKFNLPTVDGGQLKSGDLRSGPPPAR